MFRTIFKAGKEINIKSKQLLGLVKPLSTPSNQLTPGEQELVNVLKQKFPEATDIQVADVSGGCGAMFQIAIESNIFKGKRTIQQHRLVTEALSSEIKEMHGLQISTKVPQDK